MLTIGVTGGIGSGKTTVTDHLESKGIVVVDADRVAREVVQPETHGLQAIISHFGDNILLQDGTLDRAKLRQIVFNDENQKQWLNQLLHPIIRGQLLQKLQDARSEYVVLSAPLLLENNLEALVDRVLVVDIPEEVQLERASARDSNSKEQIQAIMDSQMNRSQRLVHADDIVCNNSTVDALLAQVDKLHQEYVQLSRQ